jgi:DNA polymerase III alpha subunit
MEAAKDFAGFTMGEADVLRKGVGKKNPAFIAKQKPMFYEGGQQPRIKVSIDGKTFITKPRNPDLKKALEAVGFSINLNDPANPVLEHNQTTTGTPILRLEILAPGATKEECDTIWHNIEDHARYSFNSAHAAAYGMCGSYPTGFLKANHGVIFMNNLINSEAGAVSKEDGYNYKVSEYVEEARSMGLKVLPPAAGVATD